MTYIIFCNAPNQSLINIFNIFIYNDYSCTLKDSNEFNSLFFSMIYSHRLKYVQLIFGKRIILQTTWIPGQTHSRLFVNKSDLLAD